MSALRVLSALFEIDTSKAQAGLAKFDAGIARTKSALASVATAAIGAFSVRAFAGFISQQIDVGDALDKTSKKLGVSVDELQRFQYAADLSGVSSQEAATALGFLNRTLGEAMTSGGETSAIFQRLGVNLDEVKKGGKTATDLLPDMAEKFAAMGSDAERTAMAMKLFGRSGAQLLPLLKQGSAGLSEMSKQFDELGLGIDDDFIQKSADAKDAIARLHFGFGALKTKIAIELLPTLTAWSGKLSKGIAWSIKLAKETNIVKELMGAAGVVGVLASAKVVAGWAKVFGLFPKGNAGIVKTLASMGWIGVIIGLVAALAFIFDDLFAGIMGGQSVIRNWLNETFGVAETDRLFGQLKAVVDSVGVSFEQMKPALMAVAKMAGEIIMSPYFVATIEYIIRLLGSMVALLIGAARAAGNLATGDFKGAGKAVDQAGNAVFGQNGFFGTPYKPAVPVAKAGPAFDDPTNDPNSPYYYKRPGGAAGGTTTVNNSPTYHINGAKDPRAVAREIAKLQGTENAAALAAVRTGAGD